MRRSKCGSLTRSKLLADGQTWQASRHGNRIEVSIGRDQLKCVLRLRLPEERLARAEQDGVELTPTSAAERNGGGPRPSANTLGEHSSTVVR